MRSPIEDAIVRATIPPLDPSLLRKDFPALAQDAHPGKPLVYLDSAATALKPNAVIDAVRKVYAEDCANVHRAVHILSQRATAAYEATREKVRAFINASASEEIIFTSGATESINLVASSWGDANLGPGDEVLITELEHHSNIVPWQLVCERKGAKLVVVPINDAGEVTLSAFEAALSKKTKIAAFAHISNILGTRLPIEKMIGLAHAAGALALVDGCQGVVHGSVDVRALDADFYAFSAHKLYGPSGVGVLYGKEALLEAMPPYKGGGDMIDEVCFDGSSWNDLPYKFEAGTPNIAGIIGFGAALDYVGALDFASLERHESDLLSYGTERLRSIASLRLIGTAADKTSVLAFVVGDHHPTDIGTMLDAEGVAVRTGHHCAQPVMRHFGVPATVRASLALYNDKSDIDALANALEKTIPRLTR